MPGAAQRRVEVYDTTLRDGAQTPGVELSGEQKLVIARALVRLEVDAIEAGFPAISAAELSSVEAIAREVEGPVVKALARALPADVELACRAVREAARPRLVVYVPTSDLQIEQILGSSREAVLERTRIAIAAGRALIDDIEFSPMDAPRADRDYLAEVIAVAIAEGATIVSVPDTVGQAIPAEFAELIGDLRRRLPALGGTTLAVHCHDDLGLALANSLVGVAAGAGAVECTINGIGARAGNAALEQLAILVEARGEDLGLSIGIETRELAPASRLVERMTGRTGRMVW